MIRLSLHIKMRATMLGTNSLSDVDVKYRGIMNDTALNLSINSLLGAYVNNTSFPEELINRVKLFIDDKDHIKRTIYDGPIHGGNGSIFITASKG